MARAAKLRYLVWSGDSVRRSRAGRFPVPLARTVAGGAIQTGPGVLM